MFIIMNDIAIGWRNERRAPWRSIPQKNQQRRAFEKQEPTANFAAIIRVAWADYNRNPAKDMLSAQNVGLNFGSPGSDQIFRVFAVRFGT